MIKAMLNIAENDAMCCPYNSWTNKHYYHFSTRQHTWQMSLFAPFRKFSSSHNTVDFLWSCEEVYHKQEVCFILSFYVIMSPGNINLIFWIKIDLVLLYMLMIDICRSIHCYFSATCKYRRYKQVSNQKCNVNGSQLRLCRYIAYAYFIQLNV